jgi:hypothetical protein
MDSTTTQFTISVDSVTPATIDTKNATSYQKLFENLFNQEKLDNKTVNLEVADSSAPILVTTSNSRNAFLDTCSRAYDQHLPLELSSDQFKLTVCQALSHHINANPETFRKVLVSHEGKKLIKVRRDDFVKGQPNPWTEVFSQFTDNLKTETLDKDLVSHITANSTTTTVATRAALDISLMDTFKAFFDYMLVTLCGIPSVTLKGSIQDWIELREFVKYIAKFDFDWYTNKIVWILDEIINTYQGNGNIDFWKKMVKGEGKSGGP